MDPNELQPERLINSVSPYYNSCMIDVTIKNETALTFPKTMQFSFANETHRAINFLNENEGESSQQQSHIFKWKQTSGMMDPEQFVDTGMRLSHLQKHKFRGQADQ